MDLILEKKWKSVLQTLSSQFGGEPDLDAVIFLIGIQESGKGFGTYSKDQKIEIMHIGICRLLSPYGYYEYEGMDADGWPHYRFLRQLPPMSSGEQNTFMKKAIVEYFENREKQN